MMDEEVMYWLIEDDYEQEEDIFLYSVISPEWEIDFT